VSQDNPRKLKLLNESCSYSSLSQRILSRKRLEECVSEETHTENRTDVGVNGWRKLS
jgi:hypothetical protein